jgi:polygalacturonase
MNFRRICAGFGLALAGGAAVCAQDTRHVTEPKIPPVCLTLTADKVVGPSRVVRDADEPRLDTARIQGALTGCGPGKAVRLALGPKRPTDGTPNAFLTGPLVMPEAVTLLIDAGVTLYGSRNPADYDYSAHPGICGTTEGDARPMGTPPPPPETIRPNAGQASPIGCRPLISIANAKNAGIVGAGAIDGRGDMQLIGHDYTWWQMARKAEPGNKRYYSGRLIVATHADGLILYGITLHNSPNFHVSVNQTNGFTAWGVHLLTPTVKGTDARNTDGIDPGSSTNVTVANSWIDNGDDNIAIKTGVTHMSVLHNHFYSGHGMSIGSETYSGDSFLLVDDLVEDHTTSGIRVKSNVTRGGLVHDLTYRNICMRDVQVPIAISPYYNNGTIDQFVDPGFKGDRIPDYKSIAIEHLTDETPGDVLIAGYDEAHRTQVSLADVTIKGITPEQVHVKLADIVTLSTNIPFDKTGGNIDVKVVMLEGKGTPYSCEGKFLPMR